MNHQGVLCVVASLAIVASSAHARQADCSTVSFPRTRIQVVNRLGGLCDGSVVNHCYSGTTPVTLGLATCARQVFIVTETPLGVAIDMPRITLTGGPAAGDPPVEISLGFTFNQDDLPPIRVGQGWGGLDASALANAWLYGAIRGNLTGSISVTELHRFDADGTVLAPVLADRSGSAVCAVDAGSISSGGIVRVLDGSITRVRTTGNLSGRVEATNGNIALIDVGGNLSGPIYAEQGGIGTISVVGDVTSPDIGGSYPIRAKNGIDRLIARSVSANITAAVNSGPGKVGLFQTTNGVLSGTLIARELTPPVSGGSSGININGNLTGNIRLFSNGPRTELIRIKGSLAPGAQIRFDGAGDLMNQVIINAGNQGGTWQGEAIINYLTYLSNPADPSVVVLSPSQAQPNTAPHYERPSAQLGNGAVGLVPFALYEEDSIPQPDPPSTTPTLLQSRFCRILGNPNGYNFTAADHDPVQIRFYGPVQGDANSIQIEHLLVDNQWEILDNSRFEIFVGAASGTAREIKIFGSAVGFPAARWMLPSGRYRVTRRRSRARTRSRPRRRWLRPSRTSSSCVPTVTLTTSRMSILARATRAADAWPTSTTDHSPGRRMAAWTPRTCSTSCSSGTRGTSRATSTMVAAQARPTGAWTSATFSTSSLATRQGAEVGAAPDGAKVPPREARYLHACPSPPPVPRSVAWPS